MLVPSYSLNLSEYGNFTGDPHTKNVFFFSGAWIAAMAFCRSAAAARSSERADFKASFRVSSKRGLPPKSTKNIGGVYSVLLTNSYWILTYHTNYGSQLSKDYNIFKFHEWYLNISKYWIDSHIFAGWEDSPGLQGGDGGKPGAKGHKTSVFLALNHQISECWTFWSIPMWAEVKTVVNARTKSKLAGKKIW